MTSDSRVFGAVSRFTALLAVFQFTQFTAPAAPAAPAQLRDGGIDPSHLGKGNWIYILPEALNLMGGSVAAVTNLGSMMAFLKNQGLNYIILKAGAGDTLFPSNINPQFTPEVVNAAHAAGLRIFGYNRSEGLNIPGEVGIANHVFTNGADGFVFDAEEEWESPNLPNNMRLARQLCSAVRANWPNKFLAHSPFAYIYSHPTFPYKEFGFYCDAVMPQAYWLEFGETPNLTVYRMGTNWSAWHSQLAGIWTNAIKPIVPVGQGWSGGGPIDAGQIIAFLYALKIGQPATAGGYQGVNYWRAELHPPEIWDAIRAQNIGALPTSAPVIANVSAGDLTATAATITWTSDQSSDSVAEYGPGSGHRAAVTNTTRLYYHTLSLSGLSPGTSYHFRVKSRNASNQQGVCSDSVFTTLMATVPDIILDNPAATVAGSWSIGASAGDKYGADYRFKSGGGGAGYLQFTPNITTAGNYRVYEWHPTGGNRTAGAVHIIGGQAGSQTVYLNQKRGGGKWNLLGTFNFAAGKSGYVRITDGHADGPHQVLADAIKLVYVPPPPSAPSLTAQPQNQTVNQGNAVTFSVVAAGTARLNYQWRRGAVPITGATGSSYTRNNVQANDAGPYSVIVSNVAGSVTSGEAVLTVIPPSPSRGE